MSGSCEDCGNTICVCDEVEVHAPTRLVAAFRSHIVRRRDKFSYENIRALRRKVKNLIDQVAIRDTSISRWRTEARYWKSETQRIARARRRDMEQLRDESLHAWEQYRQMQAERDDLKANQWEPADGVWLVSRHSYGRSSTLIAKPDVAKREAILRAVLQMDYDVAVRAISDTYERDKFCPVMLEHENHDGFCGVWPSAYTIWERIRDALAREVTKDG